MYNIICKECGEDPKLIRVSREFIKNLKKTHEFIPVMRGIVIALDPYETFDDINYNCTLRFPETDSKFLTFGTFYLLKKNIFLHGFKEKKTSIIFSGLFVTNKKPKHWWD